MNDRRLWMLQLVADQGDPISSETARVAARARHMMGVDVERAWSEDEPMAWEGLVEASRRLHRGLEEMLIEEFDLSISMLGIIGRLSLAPEHTLRQTALAQAMGLSLSRVSRVIDLLEQRGLIERHNCPSDARATNVKLTRRGVALTSRAQAAMFGYVQARFFDHLDPGDVEVLARVFTRLLDGPLAPKAPGMPASLGRTCPAPGGSKSWRLKPDISGSALSSTRRSSTARGRPVTAGCANWSACHQGAEARLRAAREEGVTPGE